MPFDKNNGQEVFSSDACFAETTNAGEHSRQQSGGPMELLMKASKVNGHQFSTIL